MQVSLPRKLFTWIIKVPNYYCNLQPVMGQHYCMETTCEVYMHISVQS